MLKISLRQAVNIMLRAGNVQQEIAIRNGFWLMSHLNCSGAIFNLVVAKTQGKYNKNWTTIRLHSGNPEF